MVTEGKTAGSFCRSEWAIARLFSAVGELIVVGDAAETVRMLWSLQDALVFLLVGEWVRGGVKDQAATRGS